MSQVVGRLLVAAAGARTVDRAHVEPLARHAAGIRRQFGREVAIAQVDRARDLFEWTDSAHGDWLFVQSRALDELSASELPSFVESLRRRVERLVWMDCLAGSTREQFRLEPAVDLMIRRSLVRRRDLYGTRQLHGRLHAEGVRRRFRPSRKALKRAADLLAGERPWRVATSLLRIWRTRSSKGPRAFAGRRFPDRPGAVILGWNLGLADRFVDLAAAPPGGQGRPIDVVCRVGAAADLPAWYLLDRLEALGAARRLRSRWRVVATTLGIPRESYLRELSQARLAISPFGWGEVCWRDFEAILLGALLVKPSMRHVETWPDVYTPQETYVPVRWDWSDLEAACRPYLENEDLRREVAENALRRLVAEFGERPFLRRFRMVADRLGPGSPGSSRC